jgi:hypothetical protein
MAESEIARKISKASPDYSWCNSDRGETLPERRLSLRLIRLWRKRACALKMQAGRVAYEISSEKVKHLAEHRA